MPRLQNNTEFTVQAYMIASHDNRATSAILNDLYQLEQDYQLQQRGPSSSTDGERSSAIQELDPQMTLGHLKRHLHDYPILNRAINDLVSNNATQLTDNTLLNGLLNNDHLKQQLGELLQNRYKEQLAQKLDENSSEDIQQALNQKYTLFYNAIANAYGATPLHIACSHGEADLAERLLQQGANYKIQDSKGYTPIQSAAISGEKAQAIWESGLEDPDNYGQLSASIGGTPATTYDAKKAKRGDKTKNGANLAHLIAQHGTQDILNKFMTNYPGLFKKSDQKHKRYVEHYAALNSKHGAECLQALNNNHQLNVNIDRQDKQGNTPLHLALTHHNTKTIYKLIELGANPNKQNQLGDNAFHLAAKHSNVDIFNKLYEQLSDGILNTVAAAKQKNKNKQNVLHLAATNKQHNEELLDYFIEGEIVDKSQINAQDIAGRTPLLTAIENRHTQAAHKLIENSADINKADDYNNTPLHIAISQGNLDIAQQLLDYSNIKFNQQNEQGDTPLHLAIRRGNTTIAQQLLDQSNIKLNQQNKQGNTPLHLAIQHGRQEIIDQLIKSSAKINKTDKKGNTPLHLAVRYGQADTVKQLIDQGAKVKANDLGDTPLHIAAKSGNKDVFQELFTDNKQRRDFQNQLMKVGRHTNDNNQNVLHLAATNCDSGNSFIYHLLDRRPGYKDEILNAPDDFGHTPLHKALLANNLEAAKTLIDQGARANIKDNKGITPTHLIAAKGSNELFKLAKQQYSKNLTQFDDNTHNILHYAACNLSSSDCALIIRQINKPNYITKPDNNGITPIHLAARIGNNQAVNSLAHQINQNNYAKQTAKKLLEPTDHYNTLTIAARKCDRTSLQTITDYINKLGQQKDLKPIYHEALAQAAFYKNPDAIRFLKDHSQAPAIADLEQYKTDRQNFLDHYQPGYCFKNSRKTEYKLNLRNFAIHAYILGVQKADDNLEEALGELNELNDTITHSEHIDDNLKQQLTKHYVQPLLQTGLKQCIVQNDLDKAGELYKNYTDLVENNQTFILQLCEQAYDLRSVPSNGQKPQRDFFEQIIEQDYDWPQTIKDQVKNIQQRAQQTLEAQSDNLNIQQKSDPLRNELKTRFQQQNDTDPLQINQVWINDEDQAISFADNDEQSLESKLANYDQKIDSITYEVQRRSEDEHKEQPPTTTVTESFTQNQRQSKRYYSFDKDLDSIKNGILFAQSKGKTRLGIQNIATDTLTDEEHQALQQDFKNMRLPAQLTYQDAAYLTIKQAKLTVTQEKELNLSQGVKELFHPPQQSPDNNQKTDNQSPNPMSNRPSPTNN